MNTILRLSLVAAAFTPLALLALPLAWAENAQPAAGDGERLVYVGTYTGPRSKGIYLFRMDTATGALTPVGLAAPADNPSFLALHPNGRFLYAVNEVDELGGKKSGGVAAFRIEPGTGRLRLLNQQSSRGTGPCHISVDRLGRSALVANYGSGSVATFPIHADGRLGTITTFIQHQGSSVNRERQEGPHAHCITLDPANRFAVEADLGLDKVFLYRFDAGRSTLAPNRPEEFVKVQPGSGPRHFAFHPTARYGYVINELACTVTAFTYDAEHGILRAIQTVSTLPDGVRRGYSTAEIEVHPSGKFLYGSNRGHDSVAVFAINPDTGKLTPIEHKPTQGKTPRNFAIDPSGTFLVAANQDSDSLVVFRIDPQSGRLQATGQTAEAPSPVCVAFMP